MHTHRVKIAMLFMYIYTGKISIMDGTKLTPVCLYYIIIIILKFSYDCMYVLRLSDTL